MKSMMKKFPSSRVNTGLLVLRIGVAALFISAGWMKLADMHMTVGMFASMGFSAFWAYVVAIVEFVGGIMVLLGMYTRLAAVFLTITMMVAVYVVHANTTMVMTPALAFFASLSLMFSGSGKYSLDSKLCGTKTKETVAA